LKNSNKELDGKLSELTISLENIRNDKENLLKKIKKLEQDIEQLTKKNK